MSVAEIQAKKQLKNKQILPPPKTSLAFIESLTMPLVQEVVISADINCKECQKRVTDVISRMTDTESVEVDVLEKKVTVTCKYPSVAEASTRQIPSICWDHVGKVALIKRILGFSSR